MMERARRFFQNYWVEVLIIPPFIVALCYFLYGDAYLSSWRNFGRMTFPWIFSCILSPMGCHWVRRTMLHRYRKLEDWPKRVIGSLVGYLFFTMGFALLTYFFLANFTVSATVYYDVSLPKPQSIALASTRLNDLVPTEKKFYLLLILSSMCVLVIGTIYEGVTYFGKWKEAISETEQLEKLTLESQFRSLQSQLNPHFLFNSFNVLSSLIAENPRRAEDFVDELSNVYRYLLRSNEQELATVGEELRFIRSFFHLLETRHDTGVSMKMEVPKALFDKKLPTLALQILVENAVKHNEISPEKPLKIEILNDHPTPDGRGVLIVKNNLQRKATRLHSTRVGLDNLRQRYELLGVAGFEVQDDGRFFSVTLPLV